MALANTHVHYADITFDLLDAGGALYHANYLVLADRARGRLFEDVGYATHELWQDGYTLLVRKVTSDFLRPLLAGAKVAVLSQVNVDSERSFTVRQQFAFRHDLPQLDLDGRFVDSTDLVDPQSVAFRLETRLVCASVREMREDALPARLVEPFRRPMSTWPPPRRSQSPRHALRAAVSS